MALLIIRKIDYIIRHIQFFWITFSLINAIYTTCARHSQVKKQTIEEDILFVGFFGIFSPSIKKILLLLDDQQISEYKKNLSKTSNDNSQDNINS